MKAKLLFVSVFIVGLSGCSSYTFIKTGPTYPALADTAQVQVFLGEKRPVNYTELGSVRLDGNEDPNFEEAAFRSYDRFARAVELAKKIAKQNGGDCVILVNQTTKMDVSTKTTTGHVESSNSEYFIFIIAKISK